MNGVCTVTGLILGGTLLILSSTACDRGQSKDGPALKPSATASQSRSIPTAAVSARIAAPDPSQPDPSQPDPIQTADPSAAPSATGSAAAGPRGDVLLGGVGVAGGSVSNASATVARMRGRFRRCYQSWLAGMPTMTGALTLVVRVGPNGEVVSVATSASDGLKAIGPCLKAVVRAAAFAPPEGGSATLSIPATFVIK